MSLADTTRYTAKNTYAASDKRARDWPNEKRHDGQVQLALRETRPAAGFSDGARSE